MRRFQALRSGDIVPPLSRTLELDTRSLDEETRTVEAILSTETEAVERWFGIEILDHGRNSVDLERLNNGAPLLMDHDSRDQRGVIVPGSAKIRKRKLHVTFRFSKSKRGEELMQDVIDGIRTKVSVGYSIRQVRLEEESEDGPNKYRVTDWMPFEGSSVAIPADDDTGIDRELAGSEFDGNRSEEFQSRVQVLSPTNSMNREQALRAIAEELNVSDDELQRAIDDESVTPEAFRAQFESSSSDDNSDSDDNRSADPPAPQNRNSDNDDAPPAPQVSDADIARGVQTEVERREEIRAIGEQFGVDESAVTEAIRANTSVQDFSMEIFRQQRAELATLPQSRSDAGSGSDLTPAERDLQAWTNQAVDALRAAGHRVPEPAPIRSLPEERANRRQFIDGGPQILIHRTLTGALTLADVAVLDEGIGSSVIDEASTGAPEIAVFPVDTIVGSSIELSVRSGQPSVGFRNANEGRDFKSGDFISRLFQTTIIEEPIGVDIQGVLNASRNPGRLLQSEAAAVTAAVFEHIGFQTWYGASAQSGADSKAAPGLIQQYDSTNMEVDAGDSTAKTSVWMLRLGVEVCDHVYGNDTTLNYGEWREEMMTDSNNKKLRGLVNWLSGRVAPRLANKRAALRIKNCGTDTPALDDDLLYSGYQKFRELNAAGPNAIFMTPRSQEQLRASRTATNETGQPAPLPDQWRGIPIYPTNNISEAETV